MRLAGGVCGMSPPLDLCFLVAGAGLWRRWALDNGLRRLGTDEKLMARRALDVDDF